MARSIKVETPELAVAAQAFGSAGSRAQAARSAAASAAGHVADFGGEPIGQAFATMCERARDAAGQYAEAADALARNTAAASLGYLTTDEGVVPMSRLPGFKP